MIWSQEIQATFSKDTTLLSHTKMTNSSKVGLLEWGFSRLQNDGVKFLKHAENFSPHAKIFEAYVMNFSKFSRNQNLYPKNVFD